MKMSSTLGGQVKKKKKVCDFISTLVHITFYLYVVNYVRRLWETLP